MEKQTKTIEIDLDVYKTLHSQIVEFDEPLNNVLRRVLKLDSILVPSNIKLGPNQKALVIYRASKGILAIGVETEHGSIKVLKNATFKKSVANHFTGPYLELRKNLIKEGILDKTLTLTKDYTFSSKSAAASVILGSQSNGNAWKH